MARAERRIGDVISLTGPNDYVMDSKGDNVFRMRPCYWVFETITNHHIRYGQIHIALTQELEKTDTKVCYLNCARFLPAADRRFVLSNYLLCDPLAPGLAVAGKELGPDSGAGDYSFDVAIPGNYAVVSETGPTAGQLDNRPYTGPAQLEAGRHVFHRTSGEGRVAIFLGRALEKGFRPLFDDTEKFGQTLNLGKETGAQENHL